MADQDEKPSFQQALAQANHDANHMITFWQNIGNTEYRGEGALFAYQILSAVLGGTVVGRYLETLAPAEAQAMANEARAKGWGIVPVPEDWVVLHALMVARAYNAGSAAMQRGEEATASVNFYMCEAAKDVVALFGEKASDTIQQLSRLDEDGMRHQAELWRQRQTLAYDTPVGNA